MNDDRRLSDHPTDRLIRELIQSGRPVKQGEIGQIRDRMAGAEFDVRTVPALPRERGLIYGVRTVHRQDDSLFIHVIRRVLLNGQWAYGTSPQDYLEDLRRAVRSPSAKVALYQRRGG